MSRIRQARRCRARRTDGTPCRAWAMQDAVVCWSHGGASPAVRRKAVERRTERQLRKMADQYAPDDAEAVSDPLTALLKLAGEISGFKDFLGARVADMRADSWRYSGEHAEQLRAEITLYERALDRTARVLVDVNRLDLQERLVTSYESVAKQFVALFEHALTAAELTSEQEGRARAALVAGLDNFTQGREPA